MRLSRLLLLPAPLLTAVLAYPPLPPSSLRSLPRPGQDFHIHNGSLLAPILIPRVPGTEGSQRVLDHFATFFQTALPAWDVQIQSSTWTTPTSHGEKIRFNNLIATRDPPWMRDRPGDVGRLTLVAHYDSKLTPAGFIGATDSAAPCAMLLHIAKILDGALHAKWAATSDLEQLDDAQGLQILFLDGEEAFGTWTHDDSLYGARSLAEEWEGAFYGAGSTYRSSLDSIDLFVLLDLLGAEAPTVPSYFKTTHWAYRLLADVEGRMREAGLLEGKVRAGRFLVDAEKSEDDRWLGGYVEDDHVPFLQRGVEILHLIPSPFPRVWHTTEDDGDHLDIPTTEDWAVLVAAFAAEWMDLGGYLSVVGASADGLGPRSAVRDEL